MRMRGAGFTPGTPTSSSAVSRTVDAENVGQLRYADPIRRRACSEHGAIKRLSAIAQALGGDARGSTLINAPRAVRDNDGAGVTSPRSARLARTRRTMSATSPSAASSRSSWPTSASSILRASLSHSARGRGLRSPSEQTVFWRGPLAVWTTPPAHNWCTSCPCTPKSNCGCT